MEKKEDQGRTAENLMTQITKDLKEEVARTDIIAHHGWKGILIDKKGVIK